MQSSVSVDQPKLALEPSYHYGGIFVGRTSFNKVQRQICNADTLVEPCINSVVRLLQRMDFAWPDGHPSDVPDAIFCRPRRVLSLQVVHEATSA